MKKPALAALAAVLFPALVFAQGTLSFGTSNPATQFFFYNDFTRARPGSVAELWWSPDYVVVPFVLIATNSITVNGWLTTSVIATTGPATPAGSSAWFFIHWNEGGHFVGTGPVFQNATGNPNAIPPTPPSTLDGWTSPIQQFITPEPSTFALAGLGVATLLIFRLRKSTIETERGTEPKGSV